MDKYYWQHEKRIVSVAMCPPAQRMFWLRGWKTDGKLGMEAVPVCAIRTQSFDSWSKRMPLGHSSDTLPTSEEMLGDGWVYGGRENSEGLIIYDGEYGMISTDDELMDDEIAIVVICQWPYDRDRDQGFFDDHADQLGELIDRKEKLRQFKQERAKDEAEKEKSIQA